MSVKDEVKDLTPNSLEIFEKIKEHYPPDPWKNPQWTAEGKVYDNGWRDLRVKKDRAFLINWYEHLLGSTIVTFTQGKVRKGKKLTKSDFNIKMFRKWIELVVWLRDLDFQIETMDLVEE